MLMMWFLFGSGGCNVVSPCCLVLMCESFCKEVLPSPFHVMVHAENGVFPAC